MICQDGHSSSYDLLAGTGLKATIHWVGQITVIVRELVLLGNFLSRWHSFASRDHGKGLQAIS